MHLRVACDDGYMTDPSVPKTDRPCPAPIRPNVVSVVVTCYNQAHFLREAIDSIRSQVYPHYEIVVVDDGSTDNTSQVAESYSELRYIYQHNQGLATARNSGLRESQ